jgi:hypothetical protein
VSFTERYPKQDAHGRANARVEVIHLPTGQVRTFIDDGFDNVDGEIILHPQAAQLAAALAKTVRGKPVFALAPEVKLAPSNKGQAHPLNSARRYTPDLAQIAEENKAKAAVEKVQAEQFAAAAVKPFVDAAKKASK